MFRHHIRAPAISCRRARRGLAVLAVFLILGAPVRAAAERVDLELVLAVDISGSVDTFEARLQREGYLRALVHPKVVAAVTSGEYRRIAVTYIEWAGSHFQNTVVDWTVIRDAASARAFAARIAAAPVMVQRWTSISSAIDYGVRRFASNPHKGDRRVIDISGDGPNNSGLDVRAARDRAVRIGVTINGLPIVNDRLNPWGGPPPRDLDKYYTNNVIGGPGAFIVVARGFKNFADAIRRKLVREIAQWRGSGPLRAHAVKDLRTWSTAPAHHQRPPRPE